MEETLSEEDLANQLAQLMGQSNTLVQEEKHNVHTFLNKVATSEDTTKTGNLNEDEIGMPKLPLRTLKELQLFCKEVANMDYYAEYFHKKAEILTATSLSKDAKLLSLAVVNRRELADVTKPKVVNKGWFKKKSTPSP